MEPFFQAPPSRPEPKACIDAEVFFGPRLLEQLLQLPEDWRVTQLTLHSDGVYVAGVVFPDGPSTCAPIALIPKYSAMHGADGSRGLRLATLELPT